jgi:(p)ppGpp synthase/HD superfamily hydrolase
MKQDLNAREFAAKAHEGQFYGPGEPYINHLDAVAALAGGNDVVRAVAYLHDVVEDTATSLQEVAAHFGSYVAECVAILSDEPGKNRKERKSASHAKLAKVQPYHYTALIVKAADRAANLRACVEKGNNGLLQMYLREQDAFRAAAYRPALCDNLWDSIEADLAS